jgi:TetR/AcrR family transcriptional regulator, lmrAB and yxaGH operons repressor
VAQDSREKMIRATVDLLRERGYAGTSLGDVLARSGGPRGSIYHHFPGGKQELVTEALRRYAAGIRRRIAAVAETGSALQVVRALVGAMRDGLRASDYSVGCAVAGVVLDDPAPDLLPPAAEALEQWGEVIATALVRDGFAPVRARRLATLVLAAFEGGIILSRAQRDTAPLDAVEQELSVLLS